MAAISANTTFALLVCLVLFQGENQQPLFDTDGGGGSSSSSSIVLIVVSIISGMFSCSYGHQRRASHVKFARILRV